MGNLGRVVQGTCFLRRLVGTLVIVKLLIIL